MNNRYRVMHRTQYSYAQPVTLCHNEAHLRPRDFERQRCAAHTLDIDPPPADRTEREDFFGNPVCHFSIERDHSHLCVTALSEVEIREADRTPEPRATMPWEEAAASLRRTDSPAVLGARQFVLDSPLVGPTPEIGQYAAALFGPGRPLIEAVHALMERIHRDFVYDPGFTSIATPLSVVFEHRRGVCQDFAHLALACLRSRGLAARYVSGYLETLPPPGQPRLLGADASHAWFSVFDPEYGWLDFDPTNNQLPAAGHITVAWGRDYSDITPIKGVVYGGGHHHATVSVEVTPLVGSGSVR
jgi:transglutaminase-like putative cysteine protease